MDGNKHWTTHLAMHAEIVAPHKVKQIDHTF